MKDLIAEMKDLLERGDTFAFKKTLELTNTCETLRFQVKQIQSTSRKFKDPGIDALVAKLTQSSAEVSSYAAQLKNRTQSL